MRVQLDVAAYGQYRQKLEHYKSKHGDQAAAATEPVPVIDANTIRAPVAAITTTLLLPQLRDVNILYVQQVTARVVDLNAKDVSGVLAMFLDLT